MSTIFVLANVDSKAFKSWFSTQTISKILVFLGFVIVFAAVSVFLYYGCWFFFHLLEPSQQFGLITANYIIRSAVLIIFLLGVGSSVAATAGSFFSPDKSFYYLLTLPVNPSDITSWLYAKIVAGNALFLLIFLLPLEMAFANTFGSLSLLFVVQAITLLLALALLTTGIGGTIALFLVSKVKSHRYLVTLALVVFFVFLLVAMFRLVFPPQMAMLTTASNADFKRINATLPLSSAWLTGNSTFLIFVFLACIVAAAYLRLLQLNFLPLLQNLAGVSEQPKAVRPGLLEKLSPHNLAQKDLVSILRSPAEAGYGIFLLLLMTLFFFLFSRIAVTSDAGPAWTNRLIVFSYVGFVFFANTYLLRLVFPLMARESDSAWFLFSLPLTGAKIVREKLHLAFHVGLPLLVLSLVVWWLPAFMAPYAWLLTLSSFWTITVIIMTHTFLGTIYPNFSQGSSPEKVSTSAMGMVALFTTSFITLISAYTLYLHLSTGLPALWVLLLQAPVGLGIVFLAYLLSSSSVQKYQF